MADTKKTVTAYIAGDATGYKRAMSEAEHHTGKTGSVMHGVFTGIGIAATGLAVEGIGKVIDFLAESSKAAMDDEVVTTRLTTALRDNVKGFTGTAQAMDDASAAARKLGFSDDEAKASLARLVTVTKDTKQSQADLAIAEDLARAKGIDLAAATDIVVKAQNGNLGALKKLGIVVPAVTTNVDELKASHDKFTPAQLKAAQAADKQASATAALAAIHKAAQGQAEAYAGTMKGSMAVAGAQVEEIMEKLGGTLNQMVAAVLPPLLAGLEVVAGWFGQLVAAVQPFIPVVQELVGQAFTALVDAFAQIDAAIQPLMPVLKRLAGEYLSTLVTWWSAVAKVITETVIPVVVRIVNAVLPPLTAALRWLANDVLPSVADAFRFIASHVLPLVTSAVGWITKNVLPPLGAAFDWVVKNVLPPVTAAFGWIAKNVLPALGTGFALLTDHVIPAIANAFQAVGSVVGKVFGAVTGTVKSAINTVIGIINGMIRAIDSVQIHVHIDPPDPLPKISFDWNGVGIGQLPYLHAGGIVPGTPGSDVLAVLQAGERVVARGASGGGGVTVNIYGGLIDGPMVDHLTNEITRRLRFAPGT